MADHKEPRGPGFDLRPGDHVCAPLLSSEQRDEVMLRFLAEGLKNEDKCICVVESTQPATVEAALETVMAALGCSIGVDTCVAGRSLDMWTATDMYCPDGVFRMQDTLDRWKYAFDEAINGSRGAGPFGQIRVAAEVSATTAGGEGGLETLFRYELACNQAFAPYPVQVICLYDLNRFVGGILRTLLGTHPKLLLGGMVIDNPGYVGDGDFV
jgi:hypothetical protein